MANKALHFILTASSTAQLNKMLSWSHQISRQPKRERERERTRASVPDSVNEISGRDQRTGAGRSAGALAVNRSVRARGWYNAFVTCL